METFQKGCASSVQIFEAFPHRKPQRWDLNFLWFWRAQLEPNDGPQQKNFDSMTGRNVHQPELSENEMSHSSQGVSLLFLEVFKTGLGTAIDCILTSSEGCFIGLLFVTEIWMLPVEERDNLIKQTIKSH